MTNRELYEQINDCEACHKNSYRDHRSKKEEHEFHLCERCTRNLEKIRGSAYPELIEDEQIA